METLPANLSFLYSSTPFTNSTFNQTSGYDDPVVLFLNAITSDAAERYAIIAVSTILFITCGLPLIGVLLFVAVNHCGAIAIFKIYCLKYRLKHGKAGVDQDAARQAVLNWWYWVSKIWFGFELFGLERIPPDEPVMFIIVHGVMPATMGSGSAIVSKYRHQLPYAVIDRSHSNVMKDFQATFNFGAWSREECVKILQDGNDIVISPGGSLEVKNTDSYYNIVWGNRKGFAKVAKDAKVTIIPICCLNLNEAFWTPTIMRKFVQSRFSPKFFAFGWGGLPVKLTAIMGNPIRYDESKTVDDIFNETLGAIRQLIAANQRIPGNKFCALLDRFRTIKINVPNNTPTNVATTVQV